MLLPCRQLKSVWNCRPTMFQDGEGFLSLTLILVGGYDDEETLHHRVSDPFQFFF